MSVRRIRTVLMTALMAVVGALLMSQPAYAIDTGFRYEMNPQHNNGKCIDVFNAGQTSGTHLVQFTCTNGTNQRFRFEQVGTGVYKIHPAHTTTPMCLDIEGRSKDNLAHIVQRTCASSLSQMWRLLDDKPQVGLSTRIQSVFSDKCLDVFGASNDDLAKLVQFDCHGGLNQKFDLLA